MLGHAAKWVQTAGRWLFFASIAFGILPCVAMWGYCVYYNTKYFDFFSPISCPFGTFRCIGSIGEALLPWTLWIWTLGSAYVLRHGLRRVAALSKSHARGVMLAVFCGGLVIPILLMLTRISQDISGPYWAYRLMSPCVELARTVGGWLFHDERVTTAVDHLLLLPAVFTVVALTLLTIITTRKRSSLVAFGLVFLIYPLLAMQFDPSLSPMPNWTSALINGELVAASLYFYADQIA